MHTSSVCYSHGFIATNQWGHSPGTGFVYIDINSCTWCNPSWLVHSVTVTIQPQIPIVYTKQCTSRMKHMSEIFYNQSCSHGCLQPSFIAYVVQYFSSWASSASYSSSSSVCSAGRGSQGHRVSQLDAEDLVQLMLCDKNRLCATTCSQSGPLGLSTRENNKSGWQVLLDMLAQCPSIKL